MEAETEQFPVAAPPPDVGSDYIPSFAAFDDVDTLHFTSSQIDSYGYDFIAAAAMDFAPLSEEELNLLYSAKPLQITPAAGPIPAAESGCGTADGDTGKKAVVEENVERRHRASKSIAAAAAVSSAGSRALKKSAMTKDKLDRLCKDDPKKAKRLIANRISAAKSKERKTQYTIQLENTVKALQIEAASVSDEVATVQKDAAVLKDRNQELVRSVDAMEVVLQHRHAEVEKLREEVQRMKVKTGVTGDIIIPDDFVKRFEAEHSSSQLALHVQLPTLQPPHQHLLPAVPHQPHFEMLPPPQLLQPPPLLAPPLPGFGQPFNEQGGPSSYLNYDAPY